MNINRSNYEIWFIDWLDGQLNSLQIDQLKLFLDQNPDLREEFNDLAPLNPVNSGISFRHKEHLKKSPSELTGSQLEYLCTAYLENDLSNSQQAELLEIVNRYPDKKKTFELIQNTVLPRQRIDYKHKSRLVKRTPFQKVRRFSVIGLSAAAAISLIIIVFSAIYGTTSLKPGNPAHKLVSESKLQKSSSATGNERTIKHSMSASAEKKTEKTFPGFNIKANVITNNDKIALLTDSLARNSDNQQISVKKVPVYSHIEIKRGIIGNSLIASSPARNIPDVKDEGTHVGKYISKTFREKFLKEKTPTDDPLKGYEIAEAGVSGLNKLFGWQMALDMKNDENGQPKSIYFRSKILKVNAPVKKREPQP